VTSARHYYRFSLALGVLAVLTLLAALMALPHAVSPAIPTLSAFAAACQRFFVVRSGSAILVTGLASLGVTSGICGLRTALRHGRAQRRLIRRLRVADQLHISGLTADIFLDPRPQAFCVGLARPRIYLSSGAVTVLDRDELQAVLAHEAHHATRRDPLRVLIARVLRDALFFLPIMRHVADRYEAMAEMAADESAVRCSGDPGALASAMLTFEERAPAGAVGIEPERVDHLLGQAPRWQLSLSLLAAGMVTLAAVGLLGAAAASTAPSGGISLAVLVAQLCMFVMALVPVLGGSALVLTVKRGLANRRND